MQGYWHKCCKYKTVFVCIWTQGDLLHNPDFKQCSIKLSSVDTLPICLPSAVFFFSRLLCSQLNSVPTLLLSTGHTWQLYLWPDVLKVLYSCVRVRGSLAVDFTVAVYLCVFVFSDRVYTVVSHFLCRCSLGSPAGFMAFAIEISTESPCSMVLRKFLWIYTDRQTGRQTETYRTVNQYWKVSFWWLLRALGPLLIACVIECSDIQFKPISEK